MVEALESRKDAHPPPGLAVDLAAAAAHRAPVLPPNLPVAHRARAARTGKLARPALVGGPARARALVARRSVLRAAPGLGPLPLFGQKDGRLLRGWVHSEPAHSQALPTAEPHRPAWAPSESGPILPKAAGLREAGASDESSARERRPPRPGRARQARARLWPGPNACQQLPDPGGPVGHARQPVELRPRPTGIHERHREHISTQPLKRGACRSATALAPSTRFAPGPGGLPRRARG